MDPSMFLQYSPPNGPPNGLPQESKLATYMNRSASTPNTSLTQSMSKLNIDSSPTSTKKTLIPHPQQPPLMGMPQPQVLIGEFIPVNYYGPPPTILAESPEESPPANIPLQVNTQVHQENVGGTTYFYPANTEALNTSANLNTSATMGAECMGVSAYGTHMYPHVPATTKVQPGLASTFYMPETIREEIYNKNDDIFLRPDMKYYQDLPSTVDIYGDLTPLEPGGPHLLASSYRVTHRTTGEYFAMRRLHGISVAASKRMDVWQNLDHPNIVRLHRLFTTKEFGDHSLVLIYDYHPSSITVMSKYLCGAPPGSGPEANGAFHDPFSSDPDAPRPYTHTKNAMLRAVACGALLPEAVLWSMLVQLTAALRAIHASGMACRTLEPTKVIMNGCRVRIAWCGIGDAMNGHEDVARAQQDDLASLGRLALALACRSIHCDNLPACLDLVTRTYSTDFKNLVFRYLISTTNTRRSISDLMPMIGARFYTQVEALQRRADAFEEQLSREVDNGRLLRILVKLGVVNERPEMNMDPTWSETGDRYMLKLFRDYIFHSVTSDGRPWIDQAHVTNALNNLDGGSQTKVELMSRDEQSVLVVSYAELKHCLDAAFEEVMTAAGSDRDAMSFSPA